MAAAAPDGLDRLGVAPIVCAFHGRDVAGDAVICVASGGNVDAAMFQRALEHRAL